jgi:glycosyltransferase involved in cell wall biosynthesis
MKVLHFNQTDVIGGAAISAYRLHQGLIAQGISSQLLVATQSLEDDEISTIQALPRIEQRLRYFNEALGLRHLNYISSFKIPQHSFYQKADIVNFHNVHGGFFNYLSIPSLTQSKPCLWTLHDMWSFTGGCVYSYDCDRWKIGCGQCPYPDTNLPRDSSHIEWQLKRWLYQGSNLTIVAPSPWLATQARKSILANFEIYHIPHGIDTEIYHPLDAEACRAVLGIPARHRVLLIGAQSLKDPRKGTDLLINALDYLPAALKAEMVLVTLGNRGGKMFEGLGIPTIHLGYLESDRLKAVAFSAADLFVFPTRADNLPLVLQESLACGTPMVSFDVGGVSDLVRPGITGYLAKPENSQDFGQGIVQLLDDPLLRQRMGQNCRAIAEVEYPLTLQAQRYRALYQTVLQR